MSIQLTGEFKKLNLIPVKKAVLDPRRGMILRTYYVNPNKFFEKIIQQKLKKTQLYITKPSEPIRKAITDKNIFALKELIKDDNAWRVILERNVEIKAQPIDNPNYSIQNYGVGVVNFITTLDSSHVTYSKKQVKKLMAKYQVQISEKIKRVKRVKAKPKKVEVKEQRLTELTNHDLFNEIQLLDGAQIKRKVELVDIGSPKIAGLRISRTLNMLNPTTPKMIKLIESYMTIRTFNDKYNIAKFVVIAPHHIVGEKKFFSAYLSNLIIDYEARLYSGELTDDGNLPYLYSLLLLADRKMFDDISSAYKRTEIRLFLKQKDKSFAELYSKYKETNFELPLTLLYPDNKQIIDYLINSELTQQQKENLLAYLSGRADIPPNIYQLLYEKVYSDYRFERVFDGWYEYLIGNSNSIGIPEILYQVVFASMSKLVYLPFELIEDVKPSDNPFTLTAITKLSKLSKFIQSDIVSSVKGKVRKDKLEVYIPIRDIPSKQQNIARRILPLQIGLTEKDGLQTDIDYVKVTLKDYIELPEKGYILFSPLSIVQSESPSR